MQGTEAEKRLLVNARQRSRVQGMNEAFRKLRVKVPGLNAEDKTFSKLEVLQCTISYLNHLYGILGVEGSSYRDVPEIKEKVEELEKRFVVHGGAVKRKRKNDPLSPY